MVADDSTQDLSDRVDKIIARSYQGLREENASERESILNRLDEARVVSRAAPRRNLGRMIGLGAAAAIVAALSLKLLWAPRTSGLTYGLDAIPKRLLEVRTMRVRGWHWIYYDDQPDRVPVKVPQEYLIKRPGKFRSRWYGVSKSEGKM